jgi:hypothetical protein
MNIHQGMPREMVDGWPSEDVHHPPGSDPVHFHYHDVEEWLEVLEGTITFFTARERPYSPAVGQALNIQPGEVHRVEIGPEGVKYKMWLPVDMTGKTFQHKLDEPDMALVRRNLDLPEFENRWDERSADATGTGDPNREFLDDVTSAELIFRNAKGKYLGKNAYLSRPRAPLTRTPSDTICILYKDADHVLLSTVVQTQSTATGARELYSNTRLFVRAGGSWKCRVWMNFPEPLSS